MTSLIGPALVKALAYDGFKPRLVEKGFEFVGMLRVQAQDIPARLVFEDREFLTLPKLILSEPEKLSRAVIAHLDETGELCAVDRRLHSADRYNAPAEARGVLRRGVEVLTTGLTTSGEEEIAAEFPQHWGGSAFVAEFGKYAGYVDASRLPNDTFAFVPVGSGAKGSPLNAIAVTTEARLSFKSDQRRPTTLGDILDWATVWDDSLASRILSALGRLTSNDPVIIITASNGLVAAKVLVSARAQVIALSRQPAWKAALQGRVGRQFPVKRMFGRRMDLAHVLGRNGPNGEAPLAGRSVLLVGCGAIGGFLGHSIAQLGAGLGGSGLTLIDHEFLDGANIARHRLGSTDRNKAKAVALQESIARDLPGLDVRGTHASIADRPHLFWKADLVIDATGEDGVAQMLNALRVEGLRAGAAKVPSLLHVWLEGNGAAARSFLNGAFDHACYRCLEPEFGKPRFKVLRDDAPLVPAGNCGDPVYTPYGPSAPIAAAALATQHAAEWGQGGGSPLLRTVRLDYEHTQESKPCNPSRHSDCPACN